MKYHSVGFVPLQLDLEKSLSSLPGRGLSICTRFPSEDFAAKRPGRDGHRQMDVLPILDWDWFRIEDTYELAMEQKHSLFEHHRDLVYCAASPMSEGAQEVLFTAANFLTQRFPARFAQQQGEYKDSVTAKCLPLSVDQPDPLLRLASLVEEDLVLLELDNKGEYRVTAACACFPSHWSIHQKLGQSLAEVHGGVPNLNHHIGSKIDALVRGMPPERPVSRINMLVNFDPRWSQFPSLIKECPYPETAIDPANVGEQLYLRNERETIVKLPQSQSLLFTIKTYQTKFSQLPGWACEKLADFHEGFDPKYRDLYRKLSADEHASVVQWLRGRAASLPAE